MLLAHYYLNSVIAFLAHYYLNSVIASLQCVTWSNVFILLFQHNPFHTQKVKTIRKMLEQEEAEVEVVMCA